MYSSGPKHGVVLNELVGWIFCLPFIGENACLWKNFKSYWVKKRVWAGFFLWINRHVDLLIRTTRVCNYYRKIFADAKNMCQHMHYCTIPWTVYFLLPKNDMSASHKIPTFLLYAQVPPMSFEEVRYFTASQKRISRITCLLGLRIFCPSLKTLFM